MLIEKDYCDYDTCVALKELGCTYTTLFRYIVDDESVPHPTLYEAQKWLREHRNIDVLPRKGYNRQNYQVEIYINYNRNIMLLDNDGEDYNSPEEALSEGIKSAVKILKDKQ